MKLTPEDIEQIYIECGVLNKPSLSYLNERLCEAQLLKVKRPDKEKIAEALYYFDKPIEYHCWELSHLQDFYLNRADQILSLFDGERG
ncbi:hypothetical protein LCGC14_0535700 [marine sediment metagenome]|uniref:Uncharacterized protein n=1 Tax=marine sediment metagenome TaxID=412755 RepID=A0A0F9UFU4_9ZZZZ